MLLAAREKTSDWMRPFMVTTSNRPEDFFRLAYGHSVEDLCIKFEAYCLSGVQGSQLLVYSNIDTKTCFIRRNQQLCTGAYRFEKPDSYADHRAPPYVPYSNYSIVTLTHQS